MDKDLETAALFLLVPGAVIGIAVIVAEVVWAIL